MNLYTMTTEMNYRREEFLREAENRRLAREAMRASGQSNPSFLRRVAASIADVRLRPTPIREREATRPVSARL